MRIKLSQTFVLDLKLQLKPEGLDSSGRIRYLNNEKATPFIVFDTHRDAPVGFGVKVAPRGKTYILQRRVGDSVFKAKVGNVSDFATIELARKEAGKMANEMGEKRRNPNEIKREERKAKDEWTLGRVFAAYIEHLVTRSPPAKPSTLRIIESCRRRLSDWEDTPVSEIDTKSILARFKEGIRKVKNPKTREMVEVGRSVTEQTFRWASLAVNYALRRESFDARTHNRSPRHQVNPFEILVLEKKYRGKAQLERDYKQRGARNPLGVRDGTLERFLRAVWKRRQHGDSRLGADYLLITLLVGARQQETAALQWRDRLTDAEAERCSWVDLDERRGFFYNTKNGSDYLFPIADALYELLQQRKDDRTRAETFVFPVRNRRAKHARHYHDPKTIIRNVAKDAKLKVLRTHDLRRTFGRIAEEQTSMRMVKVLLNHRRPGETTERYTEAEWLRFREVIQAMETTILSAEPVVYNALLPASRYPRIDSHGGGGQHEHRSTAKPH